MNVNQAQACCNCCSCTPTVFFPDQEIWAQDWLAINYHIFFIRLLPHQINWFDDTYWQRHMLPAFMQMGVQLSAVGSQQVATIGKFLDAKEQMETQRLLQKMQAEANKDYHPSIGMCEFGTRVKSLAATERKGEVNAAILSERSTDRYLSNSGGASAQGAKGDITSRVNKFQSTYCSVVDNNTALSAACIRKNTAADRARLNADIDYYSVIENPMTIGFDLTSNSSSPSAVDEDMIALMNNLYGYESFDISSPGRLKSPRGADVSAAQESYMNMRSVVAKTKVAENSFNAILALKGEGTEGSKVFLQAYLEELGIPSTESETFLGANPSYHAQMEILTKKAYQSPLFYTNLYDKPANVKRKEVAMQAIGLMQKFDLLKSYLRTEASLSILLETSVDQLQREVEGNIKSYKGL